MLEREFGSAAVKVPVVGQGTWNMKRDGLEALRTGIELQGKTLQTIADRHGKTPRQVALNFLTRRKSLFTIPKAGKVEDVRESSGGTGWKLTEDDLKLSDGAFRPAGKDEPVGRLYSDP